jgi:hypothetical protein
VAVAGLDVGVGGRVVEDSVLAGVGIVVGDGTLERVGGLVGESTAAGDGVLARSGALAHPATQRTSTHAIHAVRATLKGRLKNGLEADNSPLLDCCPVRT